MGELEFKNKFSIEQWDDMRDKKTLYAVFSKNYEKNGEVARFTQAAKSLPIYYKDEEFAEVAKKLKKEAERLLPILEDIAKHLPDKTETQYVKYIPGGDCKKASKEMIKSLSNGSQGSLPLLVGLVLQILDYKAEENIIKRLEVGDGVPQARAALRAYNRYLEFKEKDAQWLEKFTGSSEHKKQVMEMKLGLRDSIGYPEELQAYAERVEG